MSQMMSGVGARIEARAIVKSYGPVFALRGVDIFVKCGELTVLTGGNGSGKSTLLGILGGVIRATSGVVRLIPSGRLRDVIGMVSHDALSYPDLTGRQNVELVARAHGLSPSVWKEVEERFGLRGFALRPVRGYSRGQRQRIALARAVVHQPRFLLLDEPTAGLDRGAVDRLKEVVREELDRGAGVCVVTHEPLFNGMASERVHLEKGRRSSAS